MMRATFARMLAWRVGSLLRDALALACLLLVYQFAADLPSLVVPVAVPLLGVALLLIALGLGRPSALFAALLLAVVARAQIGPISGFGLRFMELLMMLALGLGGAAMIEQIRHYRRGMEKAHGRTDTEVRAAAERVEEVRRELRVAEARLASARQQAKAPSAAADLMGLAFRSEGGI